MGLGIIDRLLRIGQKPWAAPAVRGIERAVQEYRANRHMLVRSDFAQKEPTERAPGRHLALVTGYFSNDLGRATFGDTEALRVVLSWLDELGIPYDIAGTVSNGLHGLDIDTVDVARYSIVAFVCGPWLPRSNAMLARFPKAFKIGVNLSVEGGTTHDFDLLLPRDFEGVALPDLVFARKSPERPLIGIVQAHRQFEYGDRQRHDVVAEAIREYEARETVATVTLDTLHLDNAVGFKSAVQYEGVVRRLDAVITTRLHGMVFALKNGIPVVAIDAIAGGAKVTRQAEAVQWPLLLKAEEATANAIGKAVEQCLSGAMAADLERVAAIAEAAVTRTRDRFMETIRGVQAPR